jgi:uncharacterized protein
MSPDSMAEHLATLAAIVQRHETGCLAVSGGIDSMLLAVVAINHADRKFGIFHAVSPAVQSDGSERVRRYAGRYGWTLHVIDTGEFRDPNYVANPVNRCFYCKTNLYRTIRAHTDAPILSGTNASDLDDFRPGLAAAESFGVIHPYVEARMTKPMIRQLASHLGHDDLAELPAQPCLASRVLTGTAISAAVLDSIYHVERQIGRLLQPRIVRCRYGSGSVRIELDPETLSSLHERKREDIAKFVLEAFPAGALATGPTFAEYRQGSAFLHKPGLRK